MSGLVGTLPTLSDDTTLVLSRRVKPGQEEAYEDWERRVVQAAKGFPGYAGAATLSPEGINSNARQLVCRFDNVAALDDWERSDAMNRLVDEAKNYSTQYYEKAKGLEAWFELPGTKRARAPPKWKMLTVTFLVAYVVSLAARWLLMPFLGSWPLYVSNLVIAAILVAAFYLGMPRLNTLLRSWLYPNESTSRE